jgi:hypothetical protein
MTFLGKYHIKPGDSGSRNCRAVEGEFRNLLRKDLHFSEFLPRLGMLGACLCMENNWKSPRK